MFERRKLLKSAGVVLTVRLHTITTPPFLNELLKEFIV